VTFRPAQSEIVSPPLTYVILLLISSYLIAGSIQKIREKGGSSTRKLIGHSGPVYALSFDPLSGSAGPPKYLLSASADATTRLWSLDTMTNVVAYRGHQNPVWDVQWNPMGVYFATGSRDRTARLWSTDRTSCLRVYAGHLNDVDVCIQVNHNPRGGAELLYSASSSTQIRCIWQPGPATGLRGYGMCSVGRAFVFSSDTREVFRRSPSALMDDTWQAQVS
jgi:WD40 repeat protein